MTRKPRKTRDLRSEKEFEHGWKDMLKGINKLKKILDGFPEPQFSPEEHINLYTTVYNLCTQKPPNDNSKQFYEKYEAEIEQYVSKTLLPLIRKKCDEFMLRELLKRWKNHKVMVRWMSRFFQYLERYYIARRALPSLYEVGMTCFREQLYQKLHNTVKDTLAGLIARDRDGEQIDRSLLKDVMDILVDIGMGITDYANDFEAYLLKDTATYYSRKASNWILEYSCPGYMLKAEECLKRERERACHYLPGISEPKLVEMVETELLVVHANQLLEKEQSGCRALLRDEKVDDLSRICSLYHKIPQGLELVSNIFKQHVTDEGLALVNQAIDTANNQVVNQAIETANNQVGKECGAHQQVLVRKIIELHDKYTVYVCNCFMNLSPFHKAFNESFEIICNKNVIDSSSAELLATFCDNILRKGGSEKLSDEAIDDTLDKVVKLLAYVDGKDLFAEFYRKKLARRLLFDKSASDEHERSILTKMKQLCGGQFTSKMEGMVMDLMLAREDHAHFKEYLSIFPVGIDLTVNVLNTGYWPSYRTSDLNLPPEMARCAEVFKEYYQDKSRKRRLNWIYSLGKCIIVGKFDPKTIELDMSTYQGVVLLLFNNSDKLSYSDIKDQSNLGDDDLVRVLFTLSCAKHKILNKEPNTKTISPTDSFEFNPKFTEKKRRITIPLPQLQERKKVVEDVTKDRKYIIDASIVRIMKSRKVLSYQQLNTECVEQLRHLFQPDFKLIKKRIEYLIGGEFLERDPENPNMFRYLA